MISHTALIYKTVYIRMSLRKSIDLSARNDNNNEIAFFFKAYITFIIVFTYVGYARFSYTVVFKGFASRDSLFLANAGQICFIKSFESVI